MHLVSIVGCGYTGSRVAQRWLRMGHAVRGFVTRAESRRVIAALGVEALTLDLDSPYTAATAIGGAVVYYLVPPAPAGERDTRLERWLEGVRGAPRRLVYVSTTGVYGDRHGGTVNENTPPEPRSARAIRRLAAEDQVRRWAEDHEVSWCILRVPGIYGPGRLPLDRLRRREPAIDGKEAHPGNRIQVEDLASACVAAGSAPNAHRRIYNVTDGSDDSATAFLHRVARLTGLPPPPLIGRAEAERVLSAVALSFLSESRRVDNGRMLAELDVTLRYRDLDAGILASL